MRLWLQLPEATVGRCSSKSVFFKISQYSLENTCVGVSFNKIFRPAHLLKKTPTQIFSRDFKNCFFYRTPLVAASELCGF